MPTYEYLCRSCQRTSEFFQSMQDAPKTVCPYCQASALERQIGTGAGLIFKGSGFYETDYKRRKVSSVSDNVSKKSNEAQAATPKPAVTTLNS